MRKNDKVLVLGAKGMLGKAFMKVFHELNVVGVDREDFDFTDVADLRRIILKYEPNVIINCVGYTDVAKAELEPELAKELNGYAVGNLTHICRDYEIELVHISTDYVFAGNQKEGYDETDIGAPENSYGQSKWLGEALLFEEMDVENKELPDGKFYLVRISYLFGDGMNIVEKLKSKLLKEGRVDAVADNVITLSFSEDVARQVLFLLQSNEYNYGVYHMANSESLSIADLAHYLTEFFGGIVNEVPSSFFPDNIRPKYSALINRKLPPLRDWKAAVSEYLEITRS